MIARRPRYKWELLLILWLAYFLNQGDRQIYSAVLPLIKADLKLSDVELGLVATIFTLLFGVLVPLAGYLGDFTAKKWIVCLSLLTFSAGTLLTGFTSGLLTLIVFRSVATGVGETFYYPAANTLIGQYHRETRAQAMAVHQTALYVGIVVSSWAAGWMAELRGWRATFLAFGTGGLLLAAIVAWRLRDERRDPELIQPAKAAGNFREALGPLLRIPTLYLLGLAFGGTVFVGAGWLMWMPTFLYEKFHLPLREAAFFAVLYHHMFAFLGVLAGGRVSDRLAHGRRTIRLEVGCVGLLLGAPFIWLMGACSDLTMVYIALACFGFFRGVYDSNIFAALFDVVPPQLRSSATGLMVCGGFTVGATSPLLLGYIKQHVNLGIGLSCLAFVYLFAAAAIFIAMKMFLARDYTPEPAVPPRENIASSTD
jgi:MFS family permease